MTFDDWWGAYPTQEDYEDNSRNAWNASAASRDAEIAELRQQLDAKEAEVDDLGDDLAQVKRQLAKRDKQVMLLHFELFNSAEYIDTLGGTSLEARKTLAATEQWK